MLLLLAAVAAGCWLLLLAACASAKAAAANELVSDDDPLGFSLAVVEQLPNLALLNLMRLTTSTLSPSILESALSLSGSSSRPTGVTRDDLPMVGGSYGL